MKNRHLFFIAACSLLVASCSNPVETTIKGETYEKNFSFTFKSEVSPFSTKGSSGIPFFNIPDPTTKTDEGVDPPIPPTPTPTPPALAAPTVIQKYLYVGEDLLEKGAIFKDNGKFPSLTERFKEGNYTYIFVAHSEDTISINNHTLTFEEVPDIFAGKTNFNIPADNNSSTQINLERCIARVEVVSNTATPDNVKSISIQTTNFLNTLDIKTNCGVKPEGYITEKNYLFNKEEATKNPIPTGQLFTTGFNTFILSTEEQSLHKLSLAITITYNDNKTITHTISDIDPIINKVIRYKGNIFSEDGSFNFVINDKWDETIEKPIFK